MTSFGDISRQGHVRCAGLVALGIACMPIAVPALAQTDTFAPARAEFLKAYAAIQPGVQPSTRPEDGSLKTYPLYPYLQAARLQRSLVAAGNGTEADADAAAFLTYYEHEPVAISVRRTWLNSLANREQWPSFLAHYRDNAADPTLKCHELRARIETGDTAAIRPRIVEHWLTPRQLPLACEPVFEWLRQQQGENGEPGLSANLVEQRVRLILANGDARFARVIARSLPATRTAPLLQWAALIENPRREIDVLIATPGKPVEDQALLDGWTRLVRSDLDYSRQRYAALVKARKLDTTQASPYALALALRLAWNRDPEAVRYFERVQAADFDEAAYEWQARALIWNSSWRALDRAIAAMPEALRTTTRWRYWGARAAAELGHEREARERYITVLGSDNFYAAMSAAHLGQSLTPNPVPVRADEAELKRIAALPAFARARELLLAGMRSEALAEWQLGYAGLAPELRPQTVHLGMRWGWYDVSIATATQQRIFEDYTLLYPRPYDDVVGNAAQIARLPRELVYGVLRQESLYRSDAVSSAGAMGLLQLLPDTARSTARRWDRRSPGRADLLKPEVNAVLGAAHLRELHDRFNGKTPIALAGYNAGPNAALRWLPDEPRAIDVWIENIPYNETRTYVQRILWHSLVFSWLESGQPQSTDHLLQVVSRADATRPERTAQAE